MLPLLCNDLRNTIVIVVQMNLWGTIVKIVSNFPSQIGRWNSGWGISGRSSNVFWLRMWPVAFFSCSLLNPDPDKVWESALTIDLVIVGLGYSTVIGGDVALSTTLWSQGVRFDQELVRGPHATGRVRPVQVSRLLVALLSTGDFSLPTSVFLLFRLFLFMSALLGIYMARFSVAPRWYRHWRSRFYLRALRPLSCQNKTTSHEPFIL